MGWYWKTATELAPDYNPYETMINARNISLSAHSKGMRGGVDPFFRIRARNPSSAGVALVHPRFSSGTILTELDTIGDAGEWMLRF